MTELTFNLTNQQIKKLANAYKNKSEVKLKLNKNMIIPNGGVPLILTNTELKKLSDNKNHNITISSARISKGGFLPILAAIPAIAALLGAGGAAAGGIASAVQKAKQARNEDRLTDAKIEALKKGQPVGEGLWLNPSGGYGLILKK